MTRVIIFGTGAMACLFAARLATTVDVVMAGTWGEAIEAIRGHGISLDEGGRTRKVKVRAEYLGAGIEPADLAVVLVKSWQTARIAGCLPRYIKPEGKTISLQNGLGNIDKLGSGALAGSTTEGATLLGPGRVKACGAGVTSVAGPEWIAALLEKAGFDSHACLQEEAEGLLWGKLAVSCGINALTAILRVHNGELLKSPSAADLMERATTECAAVAGARGIKLPYADPIGRVREAVERTAGNVSSMLQDIRRGSPTEIDAINGAVAREGKRLGTAVPVNDTLWKLVLAAEMRKERDESL
ncbi:MAG TPA: ketopantoate reductase family protein [Acidobacteriota bacterium]|nr:ketopantoate reductase family protein [Acidobacteriota bacterium]